MSKANLQNVANGLLGTFVSRYNDIGGYWALGILRSIVERRGGDRIEIDLLKTTEGDPSIQLIARKYEEWLEKRLREVQILLEDMSIARIEIEFLSTFDGYQDLVKDTRGFPYKCTVKIRRGEQKRYVANKCGVCATHDPTKEQKSVQL